MRVITLILCVLAAAFPLMAQQDLRARREALLEAMKESKLRQQEAKRQERWKATTLPGPDRRELRQAVQELLDKKSSDFAQGLGKLRREYGRHALAQAAASLSGHELCSEHLRAWAQCHPSYQQKPTLWPLNRRVLPLYHRDLLSLYLQEARKDATFAPAALHYSRAALAETPTKEEKAAILALARQHLEHVVETGEPPGAHSAAALIGLLGGKSDKPLLRKVVAMDVKRRADDDTTLAAMAKAALIRLGEAKYKQEFIRALESWSGGERARRRAVRGRICRRRRLGACPAGTAG